MLGIVPSFLVETYLPTRRAGELEQLALRARRGAQEVTGSGTSVRFVRGVLVPDDEVCLLQFEATSSEVVETVARRAGIQYERVIEVSETANVSSEGSNLRSSRPEGGRP